MQLIKKRYWKKQYYMVSHFYENSDKEEKERALKLSIAIGCLFLDTKIKTKKEPKVFCWNQGHQAPLKEIIDTVILTKAKEIYEYEGEYYDNITIIVGAKSKEDACKCLMKEDFMENEQYFSENLSRIKIWEDYGR